MTPMWTPMARESRLWNTSDETEDGVTPTRLVERSGLTFTRTADAGQVPIDYTQLNPGQQASGDDRIRAAG